VTGTENAAPAEPPRKPPTLYNNPGDHPGDSGKQGTPKQ
jgi:hypothetical protein